MQKTGFEEFGTLDDDLAVCGELSDAEIITTVLPVPNQEGGEGELSEELSEIEMSFGYDIYYWWLADYNL